MSVALPERVADDGHSASPVKMNVGLYVGKNIVCNGDVAAIHLLPFLVDSEDALAQDADVRRVVFWREPGVLGCDSVQNAVYGDRMIWVWGDTTLARYPLGIFHATAAFTPIKPLSDFKPPIRLKYDYITDDKGAPRAVASSARARARSALGPRRTSMRASSKSAMMWPWRVHSLSSST